MTRNGSGSRLVYSTDGGGECSTCDRKLDRCRCAKASSRPAPSGPVVVARETKGRKGKGVTVVRGLPLAAAEMTALAKQLKKTCGSGGSIKNGVIEIQGDHRETLVAELAKRGFAAKRAGG